MDPSSGSIFASSLMYMLMETLSAHVPQIRLENMLSWEQLLEIFKKQMKKSFLQSVRRGKLKMEESSRQLISTRRNWKLRLRN